MANNIKTSFKHTMVASYIGYMTQAIANNFAPLLFLTFQKSFNVPLNLITLLVTINFVIQLCVDALSAKVIDKLGYRISIVMAHLFAAIGLAGLGIFPQIFPNPFSGLVFSVFFYAVGGGLIEVLVSPLVEACPTKNKSASMSMLHSFYCWGSVIVVCVSTLLFRFIGISNWKLVAFGWALIPFLNAIYFSQVPIATLVDDGERMSIKSLFATKLFWIFALLMVCAGASELAMSQWASAFCESGLGVSKTIGDLAGPCLFAILMGVSRVLYAVLSKRIKLNHFIAFSGILCVLSYLLATMSPWPLFSLLGCGLCGFSVGIMWPGVYSLSSASFPKGGTSMFALLALAGDIGCTSGPTLVGFISDLFNGHLKVGLLSAVIFPVLLIVGIYILKIETSTK